jgi:hypothetical protein
MKIKQIKYLSADSLQHLQDLVQIMLDRSWTTIGPVSFGHGVFIQEMALPYALADYKIIVCDESEYNTVVNKMIKDGYVLSGHSFAMSGKLCQTLLRFE